MTVLGVVGMFRCRGTLLLGSGVGMQLFVLEGQGSRFGSGHGDVSFVLPVALA